MGGDAGQYPRGTPKPQVWRPEWLKTATKNCSTANTRHASWKAKQIQPITQHPKLKFCATRIPHQWVLTHRGLTCQAACPSSSSI